MKLSICATALLAGLVMFAVPLIPLSQSEKNTTVAQVLASVSGNSVPQVPSQKVSQPIELHPWTAPPGLDKIC